MTQAGTSPTGRWIKARYGGLGLLVGLAIGAVAALFVHVEGRERMAALDESRAAQVAELGRGTEEAREAVAAARATEALLRARIAAGQALEEHDRANFGLSREHLQQAGTALGEVDPVLAGVEPAALTQARELVQATLLEVSPDALTQRRRIQAVLQAVDGLVPREPQG